MMLIQAMESGDGCGAMEAAMEVAVETAMQVAVETVVEATCATPRAVCRMVRHRVEMSCRRDDVAVALRF